MAHQQRSSSHFRVLANALELTSELRQISDKEILRLFDYDLRLIKKQEFIMNEIPVATAERSLRLLDAYEGREFKRERVYVTLANGRRRAAWVYVLRRQPLRSARHLQSGRYASSRGAA